MDDLRYTHLQNHGTLDNTSYWRSCILEGTFDIINIRHVPSCKVNLAAFIRTVFKNFCKLSS